MRYSNIYDDDCLPARLQPVITLSGTKECVAKAEKLVNDFLERMALELGDSPAPVSSSSSSYGSQRYGFDPRGRGGGGGGRDMQDNRMPYQSYRASVNICLFYQCIYPYENCDY